MRRRGPNPSSRLALLMLGACLLAVAVGRLPAADSPLSPTALIADPAQQRLYVACATANRVLIFDAAAGKVIGWIPLPTRPTGLAMSADGTQLFASCAGPDSPVCIVDTGRSKIVKRLPAGHTAMAPVISPDGKFAVVTHILSRFHLPTTQLDRGWMNTNATTLMDLERMEIINPVLLDDVDRGAANPWGVAWSQDGRKLVIAHAGTHEVDVVDFPALLAALAKLPARIESGKSVETFTGPHTRAEVPNDLSFLVGRRRRVRLPEGDLGPHAVAILGDKAWVANYFSDTLSEMDLAAPGAGVKSFALGAKPAMTAARQGEIYFHDASLCFQGWQSCASCHPGEARVDGLNWDLLNDGLGNPNNTKSLLLAHQTPPAMSIGVRKSAEAAVRAGLRHILFTVQPEAVAAALDAYPKSLRPEPSPLLVHGKLSADAARGKKLFSDAKVGCASCHPPGRFTDLQSYAVGTTGQLEAPGTALDTPTLIEVWRTTPYLHDGSAATIHEVITTRNSTDQHGRTSHLAPAQMDDPVAYVLSL